jgi:hypothetical protein
VEFREVLGFGNPALARSGGLPAMLAISLSTNSSFSSAFQPAYLLRQSKPGVSQTAKVSTKSSSGWYCA